MCPLQCFLLVLTVHWLSPKPSAEAGEKEKGIEATVLSPTLSVQTPLSSPFMVMWGKSTGFRATHTELDWLLSLNYWVALAKVLILAETAQLILDWIQAVTGEGTKSKDFCPFCLPLYTHLFATAQKFKHTTQTVTTTHSSFPSSTGLLAAPLSFHLFHSQQANSPLISSGIWNPPGRKKICCCVFP